MCKMNIRHFCQEWRIWIRPLLIVSYVIFTLIVAPILIVNSVKDGFTRKDQLILIGGIFVLTAVPISVWHIMQHVIHYTKPILQKHIIRILWMVPIYALNAWLGLLLPDHSIYVDSLRECYEAYVIYNFMVFLLNYLNLGMDLEATLEHKPPVKHFFPLCCMRPWEMGREFIHNCKHGILQYTVVRPITTLVSVFCEVGGVYGEGNFSFNVAFPYIIIVNNFSQFVAMYCLVLFYRANKDDLKPMRPIPKFLCIKAVVFFSFFQGVIINFLVYFGYIKNIFGSTDNSGDYKGLASELQNFLICIEMFVAAIAHIYSFPHKPYHINLPQYADNLNWYDAFIAMWDISDVQEDVSEHVGVVSSSLWRRFRGRNSYQIPRGGFNTETQQLIQPSSTDHSQCYQSEISTGNIHSFSNTGLTSKNRYGALDNVIKTTTDNREKSGTGLISLRNSSPSEGGPSDVFSKGKPSSSSNYGIAIKDKRNEKMYSPYCAGAPQAQAIGNYFQSKQSQQQLSDIHSRSGGNMTQHRKDFQMIVSTSSSPSSLSIRNDTNTNLTSSRSDSNSVANPNQQEDKSDIGQNIKKSDSSASDWLSTPSEEFLGIEVKGINESRTIFTSIEGGETDKAGVHSIEVKHMHV